MKKINVLISLERLSAYSDISDILNPKLLRIISENSNIKIRILISGYSLIFSKYFEREHECEYIIQQLNNTFGISFNHIEFDDGCGRCRFILSNSDIDIAICENKQLKENYTRTSKGKLIPVYSPYDDKSLDELKEYLKYL